jgi:hypothetical protein
MAELEEKMQGLRESVPQAGRRPKKKDSPYKKVRGRKAFAKTEPMEARSITELSPGELAQAEGHHQDVARFMKELDYKLETGETPASYKQLRSATTVREPSAEFMKGQIEAGKTEGTLSPGEYHRMMLKLRRMTPQADVAYPTSDPLTGESELEGEAYPQSKVSPTPTTQASKSQQPPLSLQEWQKRQPGYGKTAPPKAEEEWESVTAAPGEGPTVAEMAAAYKDYTEGIEGQKKAISAFDRAEAQKPLVRNPFSVNEQGVTINKAVADFHGTPTEDEPYTTEDVDAITQQHEKTQIHPGMSDEDRADASGINFDDDQNNANEVYSGDGPGGDGEIFFYEDEEGGNPRGYWVRDGEVTTVTGMLFPPSKGL